MGVRGWALRGGGWLMCVGVGSGESGCRRERWCARRPCGCLRAVACRGGAGCRCSSDVFTGRLGADVVLLWKHAWCPATCTGAERGERHRCRL